MNEQRSSQGAPPPADPHVSSTVLYMSVSVDGFIAGPNEDRNNPLGDDGIRLHSWFPPGVERGSPDARHPLEGVNGQIFDEVFATGAIVAGPGTFEPAGGWGGDHHDGRPIFIYSRSEPGIDISAWPLVTYHRDIETAMTLAKEAAGGADVLVHGAGVTQAALESGLLDELELHIVPVLLGQGRRLFDGLDPEQIELERVRTLEGEHGVTHLRYRVVIRGHVR
jgi:dihydrofolate reductase